MDPALLPGSIDWDNLEFFTMDETPPLESSKDTVVEASTYLHIDPRLLTGEIGFEDLAEANSEQRLLLSKKHTSMKSFPKPSPQAPLSC